MKDSATSVANESAKSKVVVVLGVHRSGTSLTTRVLSALGVKLGGELLPGRSDNPAGFFEHRGILDQTTEIDRLLELAPFGDGAFLPSAETDWDGVEIARRAAALKDVVAREIEAADGTVFGFKDPRSCYLLQMWQTIFRELDVDPVYVLALRNPADSIASMMRRRISHAHAETIWLLHMAETLCNLPEGPHAIADYERWFTDPEAQAQELSAALGLPTHVDEAAIQKVLQEAVREDLRHHAASEIPEDLAGDLYRAIQAHRRGAQSWQSLRDLAHATRDMGRTMAPLLAELRNEPAELRAKLQDQTTRNTRLQERMERFKSEAPTAGRERLPVDQVLPRHPDPYDVKFPSLNRIKASSKTPPRALKVCIATEDIVGPIRNGGIGTTYTDLAFMLAEAGHEATILYLRGPHSEDGSIQDWIDWYAERGVTFLPATLPENSTSPSQRWLRPMYALYQHLLATSYDLVHVSEWRGSAFMALSAKHQGLAFKDTVFCIKTSSPWLWNREYGLHTIDHTSDLLKMFAERRSVELADLVVGGSAHLLRWMLEHGYRLPEDRTFVQPNVVKPVQLPDEVRADRPAYGTRVTIKELVFFGRLEHRKGLDIFCEAVNLLLERGVTLPPITLLGKFGARIPTHPEMNVKDYIAHQTADWPMETQIISTYGQAEALTYLHGDGRFAVMPSVIENSTMAVYETTQCAIPFIASKVGGTPELVANEHRKTVLVDPHPVPLANKLAEALKLGGFVAKPSFDNDANLSTWLNFHARLSAILDTEGWPPENLSRVNDDTSDASDTAPPTNDAVSAGQVHTSVCLVLDEDLQRLTPTLEALLRNEGSGTEVIVVAEGGCHKRTRDWLDKQSKKFARAGMDFSVHECERYGFAAARNFAAKAASGTFLLFISPDAHPTPDAIATFRKAADTSGADVLTSFYARTTAQDYAKDSDQKQLVMLLAGDVGFHFYSPEWVVGPALYIRRQTFEDLGGFTTDYGVPAADEEFVAHAMLTNKGVEAVPDRLVDQVLDYPMPERYNYNAVYMRTIRPYIAAAPLCYQPLLMGARTLETRRQLLLKNNTEFREQRDFYKKRAENLGMTGTGANTRSYRIGRPERWSLTVLNRLRRLVGK